jgi:hypothetical protein
MLDLATSIVFIISQLLLLGLLFGPFLLSEPQGRLFHVPKLVKFSSFAVPIGIIILTGAITLIQLYGEASMAAKKMTLTKAVFAGAPVVIRFHPKACQTFKFGAIQCGSDFHGRYDADTNRWTITGFSMADQRRLTMSSTTGDKRPGSLSVWGMWYQFDDTGTIYYQLEEVGKAELD